MARAVVANPQDETRVDLVVAMSGPDAPALALARPLLQELADYWNVRLFYVFSRPVAGPLASNFGGARRWVAGGRIDGEALRTLVPDWAEPHRGRWLFAVCGAAAFEATVTALLRELGAALPVEHFPAGTDVDVAATR